MKIIAIFVLIIAVVGFVIILTAFSRKDTREFDSQYYDEDGDHVYYDRSIKEKKEYARRHPSEVGRLRTFRNLFKGK